MLDDIDKTIKALCECIQESASKKVVSVELAETTKALANLLLARADVATVIQ